MLDGSSVLGAGERVVAGHVTSIDKVRAVIAVVEWLTFEVAEDERHEWLAIEENVWSRFLEAQDGFLRKQMWVEDGDPGRVHAVIWWESLEKWKRITPVEVARVDERMGRFFRDCSMRVYEVVRDC